MLEQKIDALTKAVEALTAAIEKQGAPVDAQPEQANEPAPPKAEKVEAQEPEAEQAEEAAPAVKREDLQDLCMQIVRGDRSKKATVKAAIAEFDNAETLKDVAEENLPTLKAKLEAI